MNLSWGFRYKYGDLCLWLLQLFETNEFMLGETEKFPLLLHLHFFLWHFDDEHLKNCLHFFLFGAYEFDFKVSSFASF